MRRGGTIARYASRYRSWLAAGGLALVFVNACDVALPLVLKLAIDDVVLLRGALPLSLVAGLYLAFVCAQAVYRYLWRRQFIGGSHRVANDLRRRLYERLVTLSPAYFDRARTGDLMSRATGDIESVRQFFSQGMLLTLDTIVYLAIMPPIMILLSPELTLLTLAPLPLVPILVARAGRAIHARSQRAQELVGDLSALVEETVAGVRVVKSFAQEERQLARIHEQGKALLDAGMGVARVQGALQPAVTGIMAVGVAIVILAGGRMAARGEISVGDFVAFQHYLLKIAWPMQAIGMTVGLYQRAFASMERIDEVLEARPEVEEAADADPSLSVRAGAVRMEGVRLRYGGAAADALSGVTLDLPAGRLTALVGPVGAGKSSLLALLPRLYDATEGRVDVDGADVRRYPLARLRAGMACVPQETLLFADTIEANIAAGAAGLEGEALAAAVREAARAACIHEEIEAMPHGYASLLGERGVTLSGGQRQRLAIARALVRSPKLLILDDCLSAVDAETEARILAGVLARRGAGAEVARPTCIFATHRLAAARLADEIVVLEGGRVAERGAHEALVAGGGVYARLWAHAQLADEIEACA